MARVTPSFAVRAIDERFPWATDSADIASKGVLLDEKTCSDLGTILDLFQRIPDELLATAGDNYGPLLLAEAEIRNVLIDARNYKPSSGQPAGSKLRLIGRNGTIPVVLLRGILSSCSDQAPSEATHGLEFLKPEKVRRFIRLDLSATESAYRHGEWKAATVLGGSVLEALILWAILEKWDAAKPLPGSPAGQFGPKEWKAKVLINVAAQAKLINGETQRYAELAKNARDLIHPARAMKEGYGCDQGTAAGTLAAVHFVIRDLTTAFPLKTDRASRRKRDVTQDQAFSTP
jgi:hypothetical protein